MHSFNLFEYLVLQCNKVFELELFLHFGRTTCTSACTIACTVEGIKDGEQWLQSLEVKKVHCSEQSQIGANSELQSLELQTLVSKQGPDWM
jgi:hypothetical protein